MKLIRLTLTICTVHVMLGNVSNLCSAPPSVEELERKAITYRLENVRQGYVRMRVIDNPSPHPMERLYESTFEEKRVRQVRRCRLLGKRQWGGPEKIIVTPKRYMKDDEYTEFPTSIKIAPATDYKSPREHLRILNLQALGMDINGADMLHIAHVESLLNRADRSNLAVQADRRGDLETWRIDYEMKQQQRKTAVHTSLWIVPNQGFGIVGIEMKTNQDGKLRTWVTDSQLKQYPAGDIWYPFKVTKTVKVDDRVVERQVITIEEARFGGLIDETVFTPAGLDLKPGRQVIDSTSGQPWGKIWDGKKMADPSGVPTAIPPRPPRPSRRWLLWPLSAALALLAILYFWRVIRQRRSPSQPPT